jgi:glycosyltransferase involved in cell wall biosynthesis
MRTAVVTNFCPHYRRPLFMEMSRRMDLTLILTSRGSEWYWEGDRPSDTGGIPTILASGPLKTRRELRAGGYDAVISGLTGRATLGATFRTARALSLPFVLWVGIWEHPLTLAHLFSRPVARRLYRSADAVATYGTHVSDFVLTESGRTEKVFVSPQAVDNERFRIPVAQEEIRAFRNRFRLTDAPTFTFVGRITKEKGLDVLMAATSQLEASHELIVAGTGPLLESMKARAYSLGINERVRFIGHIDQNDLPVLLHASDALVLPSVSTRSFKEPWGLVVNEAMNCRLPVIVTDSVGAAAGGLVIHQETGLVVPQRDASALASALEELACDKVKRRSFGEAASSRVLSWNYGAAADAFDAALAAASSK